MAKSTVAVSNRANLSPSTPIPFEGGKGFLSVDSTEYLPFLSGDHNYDQYGQLLLESRLLSNTNNACVTTKRDYCAGSGFQYENDQPLSKKELTWLQSLNRKNESIVSVNRQILESHFTFGNTPIELVRLSIRNKRYLFVYVHNMLEWRFVSPTETDDLVIEAVQSKLFLRNDYRFTADDWKTSKRLPLYNPLQSERKNWKTDSRGAERTLLWFKNPVTGFPHYGLPSNVASLIYQILEFKGARFELDNFDNGLVTSAALVLKGNVTDAEINKIGKRIISSHTGDGKRGRVIVIGSEEGIDGSDIHNFNTEREGSYLEADSSWVQKIILANEWDAILAGILSPSTLGKGANFLAKILEIKQKTVIRPIQKKLIDDVWSTIFTIANRWLGLSVDINRLQIKNAIDISALTDVDITPVVKVDEVRDAKGLTKIGGKRGEKMLGELSADQKRGVYVKDKKNNDDV